MGAIFSATQGALTPLITSSDGVYSIAKVNGITPAATDPGYEKDLRAAMSWDAYRSNIRMETVASALSGSIVAGATTGDQPQLHLAEIVLAGDPTAADTDTGKVRARHILYSPEDDPSCASAGSAGSSSGSGTDSGIPPADPSWTVAQAEAGLATGELQAITDVDARRAAVRGDGQDAQR